PTRPRGSLGMTAVAQPSAHAAESPVAKDRPRRWGWLAPLLSILAGTTAIAVHAARYGNWIADDAAITFAYSRSLATGSWFSLQPGVQPVEGFSDPTWMVSLTIGRLLGL